MHRSRVCREATTPEDHAGCTGCEGCLCHGVTTPAAGIPALFAEARERARENTARVRAREHAVMAAARAESRRLTA